MVVDPHSGYGQHGHELRALLRDLASGVVVLLPSHQCWARNSEPEAGPLVPRDAVFGEHFLVLVFGLVWFSWVGLGWIGLRWFDDRRPVLGLTEA